MSTIEESNNLIEKLWNAADALRGNISSERYMFVLIQILFIKYISDKYTYAIEDMKKIKKAKNWKNWSEDHDFLSSTYGCSFVVADKATWKYIKKYATSPEIAAKVDAALYLLEDKNPKLKGLFDKNYNSNELGLDPIKLGEVINEFDQINLETCDEDFVGRIYEYFLGHFFKKQGSKGGEFYTPSSIVDILVRLIKPKQGTIYDPACGTGGMFVQASYYMRENNLDPKRLVIYGQEYSNKIWKLARLNLLIHNFNADNIKLGGHSADTFTADHWPNSKFDYIFANPPFNMKKWWHESLKADPRWQWGNPPSGNANYAWLSHITSKLNTDGKAGVVLSKGSITSARKQEFNIRKQLLEDNKIDAIITLPEKLFYTTGIPACLWIINNNKKHKNILMMDASELPGNMITKKLRELTDLEIKKISDFYFQNENGEMVNEPNFAKTVSINEIAENDYSLLPGIYIDFKEEDKFNTKESLEELKTTVKEVNNLMNDFEDTKKEVDSSMKTLLKKIEDKLKEK